MNSLHLQVCASPEWREIVEEKILPEALYRVDLGTDVIEIGPGPGFTTDVLKGVAARLTAVELDPDLAASLEARMTGSNVRVICGDAVSLDLPDDGFTGAASFHMLHHIETAEDQDRVFAELARVLEPGGVLVAADGVENEGSRGIPRGRHLQPDRPRRPGSAPRNCWVRLGRHTHPRAWLGLLGDLRLKHAERGSGPLSELYRTTRLRRPVGRVDHLMSAPRVLEARLRGSTVCDRADPRPIRDVGIEEEVPPGYPEARRNARREDVRDRAVRRVRPDVAREGCLHPLPR